MTTYCFLSNVLHENCLLSYRFIFDNFISEAQKKMIFFSDKTELFFRDVHLSHFRIFFANRVPKKCECRFCDFLNANL